MAATPPTVDGELAELTASDTPALAWPPLEPELPELDDDMPELEPEPPELEPLDPPSSRLPVPPPPLEHASSAPPAMTPDIAAYLFMRFPIRVSPLLRCTAGHTEAPARGRSRRARKSTIHVPSSPSSINSVLVNGSF
jgi:hypothetical protein